MSSLPTSPDPATSEFPALPETLNVNLLMPKSWNQPLWSRLPENVRARLFPPKLPPVRFTSRPVDVGMLTGDKLSLPWYRTIFTSIGDVISPETLPPLELESRPVDVGELIGDQMAHGWWTSLLRNLADRVAPEREPALQLTSAPADLGPLSGSLLIAQWSSVISTPKVFLPDKPKSELSQSAVRVPVSRPKLDPAEVEEIHVLEADLRRDLHSSRLRQRIWISLATAEVIFLIATAIWWK